MPELLQLSWLSLAVLAQSTAGVPGSPGAEVCAARGECHEEQGALRHSSDLWWFLYRRCPGLVGMSLLLFHVLHGGW